MTTRSRKFLTYTFCCMTSGLANPVMYKKNFKVSKDSRCFCWSVTAGGHWSQLFLQVTISTLWEESPQDCLHSLPPSPKQAKHWEGSNSGSKASHFARSQTKTHFNRKQKTPYLINLWNEQPSLPRTSIEHVIPTATQPSILTRE